MTKKKRIITTVLLGILLVLLYIMIFQFSAQNGETSGNLSQGVTKSVITFLLGVSGGQLSQPSMDSLCASCEAIIRKAAHFSEYAVMGILTFGILNCYLRRKKAYFFSSIWVLISAILDEWHQYYIPGRWASAFDVMIDTSGGMIGAACCVLCIIIIEKKKTSIGI